MLKEKFNAHLKTSVSQIWSQKISFFVALVFFFELVFFKELSEIHFLTETSIRLILCGLTGTLFFYLATIEASDFSLPKKNLAILNSIGLFILVFFIWSNNTREPYLLVQIPLLFFVGLLFHRSLIGRTDTSTWEWQNSFVNTVLEGIFVGLVFVIAIYLLIYLIEFVFEVHVPKSFHEFVAKCGGSIVPSVAYLSRLATTRSSLNKFGEGIIKFVFTPLWAIYVFFLNIYALKVLIHWSLPKGMVAIPVSIAFIAFAFKWWGSVPLKNGAGVNIMSPKLEQYIRWMHLPLLALFWVAVARRLTDYGITQPRYFLILLGLFYSCIVGLELRKRLTGRWYSVLLLLAVTLSFFKVGS